MLIDNNLYKNYKINMIEKSIKYKKLLEKDKIEPANARL